MISTDWLINNVGVPSNKIGSTYSDIFRLTGAYTIDPSIERLERLIELVNKFTWSEHSGARAPEERNNKAKQARALSQFCVEVKRERIRLHNYYETLHAIPHADIDNYQPLALRNARADNYAVQQGLIRRAIAEMQVDDNALLSNTGRGMTNMEIEIAPHPTQLGSVTNRKIRVNPIVVHNNLELKGLLVHEYHHSLCKHNHENNVLYIDEFVAHHKQFSITRPLMSAASLVQLVTDALNTNYRHLVGPWTAHHQLLTDINQAGQFQILDNANSVMNPRHEALPLLLPGSLSADLPENFSSIPGNDGSSSSTSS
jgi:hypothetical protein